MERLRALLRQPEFHAFLFFLALVVFLQPLLTMSNVASPGAVLRALFLPWAVIIALLFVTSRGYTTSPSEVPDIREPKSNETTNDGGDDNDGEWKNV